MQFKIITNEVLKRCLSNLLMNNYKKSYLDFIKFVKLNISEEEFETFKRRGVEDKEIEELILKSNVDAVGEVKRVSSIWREKEDSIVKMINEITGVGIDTKQIICYVDPYQNGGYYGEDSITVGVYKNPEDVLFVIAHELFHVFYWRKLAELDITKSVMGKEKLFEWEIAEVTNYLLMTKKEMKKFWENIDIEVYPEIEEALKRVKDIWEENSFDNYLIKAYELYKNEKN